MENRKEIKIISGEMSLQEDMNVILPEKVLSMIKSLILRGEISYKYGEQHELVRQIALITGWPEEQILGMPMKVLGDKLVEYFAQITGRSVKQLYANNGEELEKVLKQEVYKKILEEFPRRSDEVLH